MRPKAPRRSAVVPPAHDDARTTAQIRRFSLIWLGMTVLVLVTISGTSWLANSYRAQADHRAEAIADAELSVAHASQSIEQLITDRASYDMTGDSAYVDRYATDEAALRGQLRVLRQAAHDQGHSGPELGLKLHTLAAASAWLAQSDRALAASVRAQRNGARPRHQLQLDTRAGGVLDQLAVLNTSLPKISDSALADAQSTSAQATAVRTVATLAGLLLLLAGGVHLVRRAYRLAAEADERTAREEAWREQIEAVTAWALRAKDAATRSQLIGFANLAPKEALGAQCFVVCESAPPAHPSHGLPRLVLEVDDAGRGLHVSVCFLDDRGDVHDHHALDLLLGHLSALWRTVLRQEELERAAGHDALTGLPNRRLFENELKKRVAVWKRRGLGFAVAMVDLDHFKMVNDLLGHPEGDSVLRRTAEALRSSLRHSDRVFRYGGEEFAMILETIDPAGVEELLERARETVKALAVEPELGRPLSISIGWAVFGEDADERDGVIARADAALYEAKRAGRDRVVRGSGDQQAA
jgi:diguanylate cyclase (GGDEF)-like protein